MSSLRFQAGSTPLKTGMLAPQAQKLFVKQVWPKKCLNTKLVGLISVPNLGRMTGFLREGSWSAMKMLVDPI